MKAQSTGRRGFGDPAGNNRRLRILMVTPRYTPYVGGVEQHVQEVARRLVSRGFRTCVVTTDPTGRLAETETIAGVEVRRVRAWPRRRDYYFAPGIYRTIIADRHNWDIVHIQSYHTFVAPLAMLAARRAGLPYVLTFHGGGHSSRLRQLLRRAQWRALKPLVAGASRLIAIAAFEIELYGTAFRVPRERFEVIPNGIDLPPQERVPPSGALIASVGRLERYKGHQRILAAMPAILAAHPDARLWIAGTGPYERRLREQAARLGVADRVEIRAIPAAEREQMAVELAGAAVVVLLSEYETQPLAILEAVALGRPAVVANTSGLSELAQRGLAIAIPLESGPDEVAAAVVAQLEHPRIPPEGPLPTWEDCVTSLLRLYERTLASPRH